MSTKLPRKQMIKKLANAINDYRGKYNLKTGKWYYVPAPTQKYRVERWLTALGLETRESMQIIDNFSSFQEFHRWLDAI